MKNLSFDQFAASLSKEILWKHVNDYVELTFGLLPEGQVIVDILVFDSDRNIRRGCGAGTYQAARYDDIWAAYVLWCGIDGNEALNDLK